MTTRSSFPDSVQQVTTTTRLKALFTFQSCRGRKKQPDQAEDKQRRWMSPALHPATLLLAIIIPLLLILTLELLLRRSQRDQGIIFAPEINALPLSRTFVYQYLPTILAVIFSIFWAWIDLETKRMEPWFNLSRKEGALGKDSLLLTYPFGFLPFIPVRAFRNRHWAVFCVSLTLMFVTWGLIPTQAGIFSTESIQRTFPTSFNVSRTVVPVNEQPRVLNTRFAQSTYGIVVLNETLPPYMTRNYTLAPFKSSTMPSSDMGQTSESWTARTTLYSLDLKCEPATQYFVGRILLHNSTSGCRSETNPIGNETIHLNGNSTNPTIKPFSAIHIPYWNLGGSNLYYLSDSCPKEANSTFFSAFTRNKDRDSEPPQKVTSIYCSPEYYTQEVNATIESLSKHPTEVMPLGPKLRLESSIFNTTWLEQQLSGQSTTLQGLLARGEGLPDLTIPDYIEKTIDMDVTIPTVGQGMLALALLVEGRDLADYLDWKVLASSYAQAYRLLFSRAMTEVLQSGQYANPEIVEGERSVASEAVVLEPVFTYVVEGFLGIIAILAVWSFYMAVVRNAILYADPGPIASLMGLVADNRPLLEEFQGLDCCTNEEIGAIVAKKRYKLIENEGVVSLTEIIPTRGTANSSVADLLLNKHSTSLKAIQKPTRPSEFSSGISFLTVSLFIGLSIALAVVYSKSLSGLPLPSQNNFVLNLLENYIPTAIATLIEPAWILFNRLLCLLQPIEELQDCNAKARDSIDLNYSSLPPQLVIWKALRAGHFILASVCTMALLANLLAVAFAGLFNHRLVDIQSEFALESRFEFQFVSINGSDGPVPYGTSGLGKSGAYRGGYGRDHFLALESNITQNTTLLPWTDKDFFYLPFIASPDMHDSDDQFEAETIAIGAKLDCEVFQANIDYSINLAPELYDGRSKVQSIFNNTLTGSGNVQSRCISKPQVLPRAGPVTETLDSACQDGPTAYESVLTLDATGNASQAEKNVCWGSVILGWTRNPEGTCGPPGACPNGQCNYTTCPQDVCPWFKKFQVDPQSSLFLECKPKIVQGRATIRTDRKGYLLKESENFRLEYEYDPLALNATFGSEPINMIAQSNLYLFNTGRSFWHNDSYPVDFMNYFVQKETGDTRLLDPRSTVPTAEDVREPLERAYASLFAAWLGANKEQLLVARKDSLTSATTKKGWKIQKEERLFLSTALFAIAEGILCTYAIAALLVYLRRPGKYLARLPISIASVTALFAGSGAVQTMQGTSKMNEKARAQVLEHYNHRYGYGSFIGMDGRVHVGIEKQPFVRPWKKTVYSPVAMAEESGSAD